jgi:phospholipid-binding lipoprotein MlaA
MMKKTGLLIISIFCLALFPIIASAEEPGEARAQDIQAIVQQETAVSATPAPGQETETPSAPDNLQAVQAQEPPAQTETATQPEQVKADDVQTKKDEAVSGDQTTEEPVEPQEEPAEFAQSSARQVTIADPLEPVNRTFFVFNDKLYFWFYKPVASAYIVVAPEPVRLGIKNFFSNIFFPVRFVNSLLQAKFKGAGNEMGRFVINSTIGLAGFIDVAGKKFGIKESDEDFGQTLAFYGVGQGFYIDWPFLGPSSMVDSIGLAGDIVVDPAFYFLNLKESVEEKSFKTFNNASLSLEDYENMKKMALDPYVAIRDAYIQYRQNKVKQ